MTSGDSTFSDELSIDKLHEKHQMELENLTLSTNPFKTFKCFLCASALCLQRSIVYIVTKGVRYTILSILVVGLGVLLIATDGPHEKHVQEFLSYSEFALWWLGLGVASSIGLGSGLHTFVLYLGPHIALFTFKAVQCGRIDLKTAPYDTIKLKSGPSWLDKDCSVFGPPIFTSLPGSLVKIPLSKLLPQVQLEAIFWGIGTTLGELPPYFIARAARMPGSKLDAMEELDVTSTDEDGRLSAFLKRLKCRFLNHSQHLNFLTILLLASVPNPLFDLAGIMCGQLGIPFWKFFLSTMIGKAIIKTHIQSILIILVCNNQLLEWVEKFIWLLSDMPGCSSMNLSFVAKLHKLKQKFMASSFQDPALDANVGKAEQWKLSPDLIWKTVIWLMLLHFFVKIVQDTAQRYLRQQQELEIISKKSALRQSKNK